MGHMNDVHGVLLQQPWSGNDATANSEIVMKRVWEFSLHLLGESGRGERPERRFDSSGKRQSKMKITTLKQIDKQDNFR